MNSEVFAARGISKSFGAVHALTDVSAEFLPGEIHAVLGENGAGKSTLMSILSGSTRLDCGSLLLNGREQQFESPADSRRQGIGMVHQHFMLAPAFSVAENLALAKVESLGKFISTETLAERGRQLADELKWPIDMETRTGDLPVGVQQRLEILKVLALDPQIIILDEPTAVLGQHEVEDLFRVLRTLRDQGRTIILIAHKLSEVVAIADRVTVLRQGQKVATCLIAETNSQQLAEWMIGELPSTIMVPAVSSGEIRVAVRGLWAKGDRGEDAVRDASLEIRSGEILGIGGVDGNGQVELAEVLAGIRKPSRGTLSAPPAAYIPQDRQVDGLALRMPIVSNLLLGGLDRPEFTRFGFLRYGLVRDWATELIQRFQIKVGDPSDPAMSLSGGNQQKIVVSRNLDRKPNFLVAVNPTRGLDFKATEFVHSQIRKAASNGCAVALFSTDLDELAELAHRTQFMSRGRVGSGAAETLLGATD
ncbi:MAG: ABC transporter ATP-binding protein [Armatimonadetes bacterium]|nr:ABC transporter ATP-binding protein [Armatimonadota bacterium]